MLWEIPLNSILTGDGKFIQNILISIWCSGLVVWVNLALFEFQETLTYVALKNKTFRSSYHCPQSVFCHQEWKALVESFLFSTCSVKSSCRSPIPYILWYQLTCTWFNLSIVFNISYFQLFIRCKKFQTSNKKGKLLHQLHSYCSFIPSNPSFIAGWTNILFRVMNIHEERTTWRQKNPLVESRHSRK